VTASQYAADLAGLYHESRLEDPRVLAAYARAQGAKDRQRESLGGLLPQISAGVSLYRVSRDDYTVREQYNNERYAVNLRQYLFNLPAWENYQKFKQAALQSAHEAEDAQAEAAVDLAQRYFVALSADDELELIMAERRATQKNLDRVQALYAKKLAMITDVLDLQARVDTLAASEVEARNQVRVSRQALSEIVGRPVQEKLSRIREDVNLKVSEQSLDDWLQSATQANPGLKARQSAVSAAQAALREGKGNHYPSLSVNLSAQQSDVGYDNSLAPRTDTYIASLDVQVPLYSGGSTSARVRALGQDREVAEEQLEASRRQVVREITTAYLTAQSSVEKIRAFRKALESAEKSSVAAQRGFSFGVVNAVDVLTSVQNEYEARRDLLKSQYDFATNLLVLNRWAGTLSGSTVDSVNTWLSSNEKPRALENQTDPNAIGPSEVR
jgi:outer membrane protein